MPSKVALATELCKVAAEAVRLKADLVSARRRKQTRVDLYRRQVAAFQGQMVKALVPFFEAMIEEVAAGFDRMGGVKGTKAFCPTGEGGGRDNSCSPKKGGGVEVKIDAANKKEAKKLLGKDWETKVVGLSGALPGATVHVRAGFGNVSIIVDHPNYKSGRIVKVDEKEIENEYFEVDSDSRGRGIGTESFALQVESAASAGFDRIITHAAGYRGAQSENGYYTWPRLGYDADTTSLFTEKRTAADIAAAFPKAKRISDLMKTQEGRDWWKHHGSGFKATFDLKEGSLSRKVLDAYVAEKRSRAAAGTKSGGRSDFGSGVGGTRAFCPTGEGGGIDNSCSPNRGRKITDTPEFKSWFGDSKAVNDDGSPKVLYHGTMKDFESFLTDLPPEKDWAMFDRAVGAHFAEDSSVTDTFTIGQYTWPSDFAISSTYGGDSEKPESWYRGSDRQLHYDGNLVLIRENDGKQTIEPYNPKEHGGTYGISERTGGHLRVVPPGGQVKSVYLSIQNPLVVEPEGSEADQAAISRKVGSLVFPEDKELFADAWASTGRKNGEAVWESLKSGSGYDGGKYEKYKTFEDVAKNFSSMLNGADMAKRAKEGLEKMGYDGIRYKNTSGNEIAKDVTPWCWIAFHPNQIKSATGNSGKFDPNNPDITKSTKSTKSHSDTAANLVSQVFDSRKWQRRLVDTTLPILARAMGGAAVSEVMLLGAESKVKWKGAKAFCPTGPGGGRDNSCSPSRGGDFALPEKPLISAARDPSDLPADVGGHLVIYDPNMQNEGRADPDGSIKIGPKTLAMDVDQQNHVLLHEWVHQTGLEMDALRDNEFWDELQAGRLWGQPDKNNVVWGPGGDKPNENIVESIIAFVNEPEWLQERYPGAYNYVGKLLAKRGEKCVKYSILEPAALSTHSSSRRNKPLSQPGTQRGAITIHGSGISHNLRQDQRNMVGSAATSGQKNKATTASQWLQMTGTTAPPGVKTEWPPWLIKKIEEQLAEAYDQDYWSEIVDETTRDDIEDIVAEGLQNGRSIREISKDIKESLGEEYYKGRAKNIARTECLPADTKIDGANVLSVYRRWYSGPWIEIVTKAGRKLTGTPNHPVLTGRGWVGLGDLKKSDSLLCHGSNIEDSFAPSDENVKTPPSSIKQIWESLSAIGVIERRRTAQPDFHGDGMDGEVYIATPDSELAYGRMPQITKRLIENILPESDVSKILLVTNRQPLSESSVVGDVSGFAGITDNPPVSFDNPSNRRGVGFVELPEFVGGFPCDVSCDNLISNEIKMLRPFVEFGFPPSIEQEFPSGLKSPHRHPGSLTRAEDDGFVAPESLSEFDTTPPGKVEVDHLLVLRRTEFHGHVYNLLTRDGYFIANGVYTSNCGAALNGGRKAGIEALQEELGSQVQLKAVWMSVLKDTTRDAHANLDGVPADADGMWDLNGVRVPYPGHYSLPPGDRCHCYCTVSSEFGYSDEDAAAAIQAYNERVARWEAGEGEFAEDYEGDFSDAKTYVVWLKTRFGPAPYRAFHPSVNLADVLEKRYGAKAFCPTGPGGGIDNSCGRGGRDLPEEYTDEEYGIIDVPPSPWDIKEKDREYTNLDTESLELEDAVKWNDILRTAAAVRQNVVSKNGCTAGFCDSASSTLAKKLIREGYEAKVANGTYKKAFHHWVEAEGKIIDVTNDQFDGLRDTPAPKVLVTDLNDKDYHRLGHVAHLIDGARPDSDKAFCPTGQGGGIDNSCSPNRRGGSLSGSTDHRVLDAINSLPQHLVKLLDDHGIRIVDSNEESTRIRGGAVYMRYQGVVGIAATADKDAILHELGHGVDASLFSDTPIKDRQFDDHGYWSTKNLAKELAADKKAAKPVESGPSWENKYESWKYAFGSEHEAFAAVFSSIYGNEEKINGFSVKDAMPRVYAKVAKAIAKGTPGAT